MRQVLRGSLSLVLCAVLAAVVIQTARSALKECRAFTWDMLWPDEKRLADQTKIKGLNAIIPDFSALREFYETAGGKKTDLTKYLKYYEELSSVFPGMFEGYLLQGYCQYYAGDLEKAGISFQKAFMLNPKFMATSYNIGMVLYDHGLLGQAIPYLERALGADQTVFLSTILSSKVLRDINRSMTGEDVARSMARKRSDLISALLVSYALTGQAERAVSLLASVPGQGEADQPRTLAYVAAGLMQEGKCAPAEVIVKRVLENDPHSSAAFYILGKCLSSTAPGDSAKLLLAAEKEGFSWEDWISGYPRFHLAIY
jgi:tetratricopeptide (TPR) repeat protein